MIIDNESRESHAFETRAVEAPYMTHHIKLCVHEAEWQSARTWRNNTFFDPHHMEDPYTWTFEHPSHKHWIFYDGNEKLGYAHVQLWPLARAALRMIVIDASRRNQHLGSIFLALIEKELKDAGCAVLHVESNAEALRFYRRNHYNDMPFDDPDKHPTDPRDTPLGKRL
ncbi:MAG: GNAT family N-acetyltransferase [Candidatus Nucleicultricaceae bacterium]